MSKIIGTFDGGYNVTGTIIIDNGTCDICHKSNVKILVIDGSGEEYNPGQICEECCLKAFDKI